MLKLVAKLLTFTKAFKISTTNRVRNLDKENVEDRNIKTRNSSFCATSIRKSSKFLNIFLFNITPVQTPELRISASTRLLALFPFVT
jgi:hypothetical protein